MSKKSLINQKCLQLAIRFVLFGVVLGLIVAGILQFRMNKEEIDDYGSAFPIPTSQPIEEVILKEDSPQPKKRDGSCIFHTCFEVYHCGYNDDTRLSVYIYPPAKYVDETGRPWLLPVSKEYSEVISTIASSPYYTTDPDTACLYLPPIDLLNENQVQQTAAGKALKSLKYWGDGRNHLLFNMLPGVSPDYSPVLGVRTEQAVLAGGGFDLVNFRSTYDVSIPVFNPHSAEIPRSPFSKDRHWLLAVSQIGLHEDFTLAFQEIADLRQKRDIVLFEACEEIPDEIYGTTFNYSTRCLHGKQYDYPRVLEESKFCAIVRMARLGQAALYDVMKFGCIPVVVAEGYVMPYHDVIDWTRAAVIVSEANLHNVAVILDSIPEEKMAMMRKQVRFLFDNYFRSMAAITLTTLQILNDRVFPYAARKHDEWNGVIENLLPQPPLFLPLMPGKPQGFTAVILAYDRLESLFKVISQVAQAPSLAKVLVVWNNQHKAPPPSSKWPKINKPLKVVKTTHNKLSNRFYPYEEIETEAILALDDDIIMLSVDEVEFGYRVWREFPDRLVGYPSRLHEWDNTTQSWRYESEWKSSISIVLTGAAFHHKYYSYLYTNAMPGDIKSWVDEHFNCEDIAMNFLIANVTGKAPIKVAPRQKFKCLNDGCQGETILSADSLHMVERSDCLKKFAEIYGSMPLKTVEFRVDPLLYKENLPDILKLYSDIGSL